MELSVVAVLITVPLFVIPYSAMPFEEAKVSLLRTVAVMCLPFAVLTLIRKIRDPEGRSGFGMQALEPLIILVCFFAYTLLLSTVFSVSPFESFFGAQIRRQGTYTIFCYLFFFFVVIGTVRSHRQVERMLLAVLLAGFLVSFWGILQYLGLDPNHIDGFRAPARSTLGNRLFLPAFLIMCVPINMYYLNRSFSACRTLGDQTPHHGIPVRVRIFFLFNLLCLTINIFIIAMAQKRGPVLGLAVGLILFVMLYLLGRGKRRMAVGFLGASGLLSAMFIGVGMTGHRFALLAHIPLANTLADSFSTGTGLVRFYLWKGVINLLTSNPVKWVFGYGPETLQFVLPSHSFSILKQLERPTAIADRAHNETLDLLVMQGFFGTAAFLTIFGIVGYHVFCRLGLIDSRSQKRAWVASLFSGCFLGSLAPVAINGNWTFSGMGLGLGLVGGCFLYLGWFVMTNPKGNFARWNSQKLLLSLLLSAMTAHFIEIQFSFGITATRLYYWVLAGMTMVVCLLETEEKQPGSDSNQMTRLELPPPVFPAILAVFAIITISFNFLCFSRQHSHFFFAVLGSHICTIVLCGSFCKPASTMDEFRLRLWLHKDSFFLILVLTVGCLYHFGYFFLENTIARGLHSFFTNSIPTVLEKNVKLSCYYGWLLGIIFLSPFLMLLGRPQSAGVKKMYRAAWLFALLVLLALPVGIRSNLYYPWADIYTKAGDEWLGRDNWDIAGKCFRNAIAREPGRAWRYQKLGHLFFIQAKKVPEPRKSFLYQEAISQLDKATYLAPLDVTLKNNLARMSSAWAAQAQNEKNRLYRLTLAETFYRKALKADPNNPILWKEAAQISASSGNIHRAIKQFLHVLDQQPGDFESHRNLALLYQASGQNDEALGHSRRALSLTRDETGVDDAEIRTLISEIEQAREP